MISMIAVIGKNNELGLNNKLLWHLPNDLKFFKKVTLNHTVIMGKNTYLSIGRKLPNRVNIVLSTTLTSNEVIVCKNLKEALKYIKDDEEVFIIGGEKVYELFLPYADNLYLTEVDKNAEADAYFPFFDKTLYERRVLDKNNDGDINYEHVLYVRRR